MTGSSRCLALILTEKAEKPATSLPEGFGENFSWGKKEGIACLRICRILCNFIAHVFRVMESPSLGIGVGILVCTDYLRK
jgi:hypothetical protein